MVFFGLVKGGDGGLEILGFHMALRFGEQAVEEVLVIGECFVTPREGLFVYFHLSLRSVIAQFLL